MPSESLVAMNIPKSWKTTTIGELCEAVFDGPHATPQKTKRGPIFLGISNLANGRLDLSNTEHLSEEDFKQWTRRVTPRANDIVFSYETRLGEAAIIPEGLRCCLGRRMGLMRPNTERVEPRFLLYAYLSPAFQETIQARTIHGSTVDRIALTEFPSFPLCVPPLSEQREIAHILGTLDDKIELNRRMNATLEAIARAIFKSWFVDFDPVHAKARGEQPYGMDADTAALFPDAFEDSELGPIPAGWGIADFGKLISQRKERVRERKATVLSAVAAGELVRSSEHFAKQVYSKDISKYIVVEQWDFAYNPSRINIGSIGMLKEPLVGAVSPVYVVFRPKSEFQWFLEFNLKQPHVQKWIVTLASGSVRQALSFRDFASIPCVIPPEPIIKIFNQMWIGLCDGIDAHGRESNTLAELRDTLLPKLISGEICVNALEEISGG